MRGSERPARRKPAGGEHKRLFFALELTECWRDIAIRAQNALKSRLGDGDCRWALPQDMHLTLLFLGEQPNSRLPQIVAAGEAAAASVAPFPLALTDLGAFPDPSAPRVLWLGAAEGSDRSATRLARALRRPLDAWIADRKPLQPHITLAYAGRNAARADLKAAIDAARSLYRPEEDCPLLPVTRFVLMETATAEPHDKRAESRYTAVHSFLLGTPGIPRP